MRGKGYHRASKAIEVRPRTLSSISDLGSQNRDSHSNHQRQPAVPSAYGCSAPHASSGHEPKVHSRYQRHLTDLPWGALAVRIRLATYTRAAGITGRFASRTIVSNWFGSSPITLPWESMPRRFSSLLFPGAQQMISVNPTSSIALLSVAQS